jgi:hypothetical protein
LIEPRKNYNTTSNPHRKLLDCKKGQRKEQ